MKLVYKIKYTLLRLLNLNKKYEYIESKYNGELRAEVNNYKTKLEKDSTLSRWDDNVLDLLDKINNRDPEKFLRWDVIIFTMFFTNSKAATQELEYLRRSEWNRWNEVIKEDKFGFPLLYSGYRETSCNSIHMAYHLALFENTVKIDYSDLDYVFEFGGGFGRMAVEVYRSGFKGKYIIFDLPVFSMIQKYYLKNLGMEAVLNGKEFDNGVDCVYDLEVLEDVMKKMSGKKALFIATWSLSETPVELSRKMEKFIGMMKYVLIAYQEKIAGIDNLKRFGEMQERLKGLEWKNYPNEYMDGHYYLFGSKK